MLRKSALPSFIIIIGLLMSLISPIFLAAPTSTVKAAPLSADDPIPALLTQISETNLTTYVSNLVGYGPRLAGAYQVYTDDICTLGLTVFAISNEDRAANYAEGILDAMGYSAYQEPVSGYGHNVIATKTGTVYPNIYIEFGAHLDTKPGTPGANDNGSGSAAVMELARVLKDYPSRYSMTFALWAGEETGGFAGAYYHIGQMQAGSKQIKAYLNMDNMGQIGIGTPNYYRNDVWTQAGSTDFWALFNQVNTEYSLGLTLVNNANPCCSDGSAYWANNYLSVTSVGGWTPSSPNYHGCGDVVAGFDSGQAARVAKQNLAAGLKLDQDILPPIVSLVVTPASIPADGSSHATATATVHDANNNPLTSETVTITASGDVVVGSVTNHGDGTYSAILTASTTTGSKIITATDSGVSATATLTQTTYCPGACFTDTSVGDFTGGVPGSGIYIAETTDGEVILAPTVGSEFSGTSLPSGWNGTGTVQNGWVTVDAAQVSTTGDVFTPGRAIDFAAILSGGQYQSAGFALNATTPPWAVFDYVTPSILHAYTSGLTATAIVGTYSDQEHHYRIEWNSTEIRYYIDGTQVATTSGLSEGMRPIITDNVAGGQVNRVNWMRMSPYATSGTFESRIFDGGGPSIWGNVTWAAETPAGTSIALSIRSGNTAVPDITWSGYSSITNGASIGISARYVQYRAVLSTTNADLTPVLNEISLRYTPGNVGPATKLGFLIQPGGAIAGSPFITQPVIAVQDESGYPITTDNTTQVTLAIGTNPSGGTLTCNINPVTAVSGVATFAGCRINNTGTGYTLTASGGSLISANSSSFNVTHNPPASIALTLTPDTISANGTATSIATATVRDAGNNPLVGETVVFTTNGDVRFGTMTDNGDGTYSVTVTASTSPGDETITATDSPVSASAVLHETLYCPGTCFTDTTSIDFLTGTPGDATYVAQTENGEVILLPTVGAEFYGTTLPTGWEALSYGNGSPSAVVNNGLVSIGTARLMRPTSDDLYTPGHVLEFEATYTGGTYQAGGFGFSFNGPDGTAWSTFDTVNSGIVLNTNTNNTYTPIPTPPSGSWLNAPHRYRIEWTSSGVTYFIDGVQVHSDLATFPLNMRPIFADNVSDTNYLQLDWVRMSPYASTGTYQSRILDSGGSSAWGVASWTADTPAGSSVALSVRSGNSATPDETWTVFHTITNGTSIGVTGARYVQYQAVLSTSNTDQTPALKEICISFTDTTPPTILNRTPAPNATNVAVNSTITVGFSEPMLASTINTSSLRLRASGAVSDVPATVTYVGTTATLTPTTPLTIATQYQVTVAGSVSDLNGNLLGTAATWTFSTGGGTFTDTTFADFGSGAPAGVYVSEAYSGEIILTPTVVSEFSGTSLPAGWSTVAFGGTPSLTFSGGWANLVHSWLYTTSTYSSGRSLEFVANMGGGAYQSAGFTNNGSYNFAIFNFDDLGTTLRARYNDASTIVIPGTWNSTPHRYRIEWGTAAHPDQIRYFIEGDLKVTQTVTVPGNMGPSFSDYLSGLGNHIDWVRMSPYSSAGTFISRVFDAGQSVQWTDLSATTSLPTGTTITFRTRTGDTPIPDGTWSAWSADINSPITSPYGRYLQYEALFAAGDNSITPTLSDVTITFGPRPTGVDLNYFRAYRAAGGVQLAWETVNEATLAGFNLYRREPGGQFEQVNAELIPPEKGGQPEGFAYRYLDEGAQPGLRYEYRLEAIENTLAVGSSALVAYFPYTLMLPVVTH
jgi:hypothetical protein